MVEISPTIQAEISLMVEHSRRREITTIFTHKKT
jgi:hypothetical protein